MTLFTCRKGISVRILVDKRDIGYPNQPRLGKKSHLLGIIKKKISNERREYCLGFPSKRPRWADFENASIGWLVDSWAVKTGWDEQVLLLATGFDCLKPNFLEDGWHRLDENEHHGPLPSGTKNPWALYRSFQNFEEFAAKVSVILLVLSCDRLRW